MFDYELNACWVDVTEQCLPKINDLVRSWKIIIGQKKNNIEYIVLNVSGHDFLIQPMARNGEPFKLSERKSKTISLTAMQENEFKLLEDFSLKYVEISLLGNWIRNYFGLWRGNYDLMLDCEISEQNADNVSTHI